MKKPATPLCRAAILCACTLVLAPLAIQAQTNSPSRNIAHAQGSVQITGVPSKVAVLSLSGLDTLDALGIPLAGVPARGADGTNDPLAPGLESQQGGVPMSLSDFGIVGCESAAAAPFWLRRSSRTPAFCPIARLWGGKLREKSTRWGRFSLSTPKVRQTPRPGRRQLVSDGGRAGPAGAKHRRHPVGL